MSRHRQVTCAIPVMPPLNSPPFTSLSVTFQMPPLNSPHSPVSALHFNLSRRHRASIQRSPSDLQETAQGIAIEISKSICGKFERKSAPARKTMERKKSRRTGTPLERSAMRWGFLVPFQSPSLHFLDRAELPFGFGLRVRKLYNSNETKLSDVAAVNLPGSLVLHRGPLYVTPGL